MHVNQGSATFFGGGPSCVNPTRRGPGGKSKGRRGGGVASQAKRKKNRRTDNNIQNWNRNPVYFQRACHKVAIYTDRLREKKKRVLDLCKERKRKRSK